MESVADKANATAETFDTLFLHGGDRYLREMVVVHPSVTEALIVRASPNNKESIRSQLVYEDARVPDRASSKGPAGEPVITETASLCSQPGSTEE